MKKAILLLSVIYLLSLCGCSTYADEDFYGGRSVGEDELRAWHSIVAAADTEKYPIITDENSTQLYLWTPNGSVRHISMNCQSLASSSEIISGTEAEAIESGKSKVCGICGK